MRISGKTVAIIVIWAAIAIAVGAYFAVNSIVKQRLISELDHFASSMERQGLTFTYAGIDSDPVQQTLTIGDVSLVGTLPTGERLAVTANALSLKGYQVDEDRELLVLKSVELVGLTVAQGLGDGRQVSLDRLALEGVRPRNLVRFWESYQAGLSPAGALETNGLALQDLVVAIALEGARLSWAQAGPGGLESVSIRALSVDLQPDDPASLTPVYFAEDAPTASEVTLTFADGAMIDRISILGVNLGPLTVDARRSEARMQALRTGRVDVIFDPARDLDDAIWRTTRLESVRVSLGPEGTVLDRISAGSITGEGLDWTLSPWDVSMDRLTRVMVSPTQADWTLAGLSVRRSYEDLTAQELDQLSATLRSLLVEKRLRLSADGSASVRHDPAQRRLTIERAEIVSPMLGSLTLSATIDGVDGVAPVLPMPSALDLDRMRLDSSLWEMQAAPVAGPLAQDLGPAGTPRRLVQAYAAGAQTAGQRQVMAGLLAWMEQSPARLRLRVASAAGASLGALWGASLRDLVTPATLATLLSIEVVR